MTFVDEQQVMIRSQYCDEIISALLEAIVNTFPGLLGSPMQEFLVDDWRLPEAIHISNTKLHGGFSVAYRHCSHYFAVAPREDVLFAVEHHNFREAELVLNQFDDITSAEWKVLCFVLRMNRYFKKIVVCDYTFSKEAWTSFCEIFKYNDTISRVSF